MLDNVADTTMEVDEAPLILHIPRKIHFEMGCTNAMQKRWVISRRGTATDAQFFLVSRNVDHKWAILRIERHPHYRVRPQKCLAHL